MTKIFYYFIAAVLLFVAITSKSLGQSSTVVDVNTQLRALFSPLTKPTPSKLFLYDMSMKFSDSTFYQPICYDTLETEMWYKIYDEMYHTAYDTTPYLLLDTVYAMATDFYSDTISIGILNYSYYKLIDSAMTTNSYFNFDTTNTILTDKTSRPGFPYTDNSIFIGAPLLASCNFTNPVFRVDPQFIFFDSFSAAGFTHGNVLKIDFGDGNGWITFNPTIVTNWPVLYSTNGEKIIKTAIFTSSNDLVNYSVSKITVISPNPVLVPDNVIKYPGITAGFYGGCNGKVNSGKTIIYLSGFDMGDCIHFLNRSVSQIYTEMISNNEIVQLKNEGYNFLVVDWENSRIDIRFNALYLVNMLEDLKCNLTDDQQFVIMGESMGGLVGRYALTYMETEYYKNKDITPFFQDILDVNNVPYLAVNPQIFFLPKHWCKMEKMHNTRLLITLDTPHQGANIPISAQLAYKYAMEAISTALGTNLKTYCKVFNLFLDCQAAQQMLIYHIDTKPIITSPTVGWNYAYSCKSDKTQFFNQLNSLGNYPHFAKVVAMSNGSLKGINQCNFHVAPLASGAQPPRIPGDRLIDFGCDIYGRVLGLKIPVFGADLKANTNPNGTGNVLRTNAGTYAVRIKLRLFGIKFISGYTSLFAIDENADVLPYCTSPGGHIGDQNYLRPTASSNGFNLSNNYWIFNMFHYNHTVSTDGCVTFDSHIGLNGFASVNFDYHLCSDGYQFCFVPTQSALDYGTLGSISLNHDIETENIVTKLGQVKADVIIGYPGDDAEVNKNHTGTFHEPFRCDSIYNITGLPATVSTYYPYTYASCVKYNDAVERSIINLEIGDEELYLENVTLKWHADYESEFDIHVNDRNPYYEYPSYFNPTYNLAGIYSKEDDYIIDATTGQATFYTDAFYSPTHIGLKYSIPTSGPFVSISQSLPICCKDFVGTRLANENKANEPLIDSYLNAYPNPNNGNQLVLNYHLKNDGQATIEVFNLLGKKIITKIVVPDNTTEESSSIINLANYDLADDLYLIQINNGNEVVSTKVIINK